MWLCGSLVIMRQAKRAERLIPNYRLLVLGGLHQLCWLFILAVLADFFFTLLVNFVYPTLLPLSDAVAARMVIQVNLDYGNVILGVGGFIVGATLIGFVIEHLGPSWILHCIVLFLLLAGFCIHVPMNPAPRTIGQRNESHGYGQLLRKRHFEFSGY